MRFKKEKRARLSSSPYQISERRSGTNSLVSSARHAPSSKELPAVFSLLPGNVTLRPPSSSKATGQKLSCPTTLSHSAGSFVRVLPTLNGDEYSSIRSRSGGRPQLVSIPFSNTR